MTATEKIDQLIHDAQHADSGYDMATMVGHMEAADNFRAKRIRLLNEATCLYLEDTDARWPHSDDCEWPAPERGIK